MNAVKLVKQKMLRIVSVGLWTWMGSKWNSSQTLNTVWYNISHWWPYGNI